MWCLWLGTRIMLDLWKFFFDPSAVFWGRIFKRLVLILLWKYDRNHPRNLLVMGFSMMGSFWLLIIKAPYLLLVCLNFSDSSWFNFCRLYVSRSFSISFRLPSLFNSVQLLSHVQLFVTQWTTVHQAPLSITNSWSLLKLMSLESVMPSNHLIHCRPLLLPPSIFPSIGVFPNESVLCIRWPKYWLHHQSFQWIFRTDFL